MMNGFLEHIFVSHFQTGQKNLIKPAGHNTSVRGDAVSLMDTTTAEWLLDALSPDDALIN